MKRAQADTENYEEPQVDAGASTSKRKKDEDMASSSAMATVTPTASHSSPSTYSSSSSSQDQPKQYPDLLSWLFKICSPDVARYIFEYLDFSTIILGVQLTNKEIRNAVFGLLNEKWWIRVSNHRWYGYFTDALVDYIYKIAQNQHEWTKVSKFKFYPSKDRLIYNLISTLQADLDRYVELNLNGHLKQENVSLLALDIYKLPKLLIPKYEIPSFLCKYVLLNRWIYEDGRGTHSHPLQHIPFAFAIVGEYIRGLIVDPAQVKEASEWDSENGLPEEPFSHPFVTWMFYHDMVEESSLNGYYTGPVYVYEEEWNKDWGVLVEDTDYDGFSGSDAQYETDMLANERSKYGSSRVRKFYWPDSDYFPIVKSEFYQQDLRIELDTALKSSDIILELVHTNPKELYKYFPYDDDDGHGASTDGIVQFPCRLIGQIKGDIKTKIDPLGKLYKYIPKYSRYWMHKVSKNLVEAMGIDSDYC